MESSLLLLGVGGFLLLGWVARHFGRLAHCFFAALQSPPVRIHLRPKSKSSWVKASKVRKYREALEREGFHWHQDFEVPEMPYISATQESAPG